MTPLPAEEIAGDASRLRAACCAPGWDSSSTRSSWRRDRICATAPTRRRAPCTSYAIAVGLFAAAGMFLIAACLVGTAALFRWIEINYGHVLGVRRRRRAACAAIAGICAGVGAASFTAGAAFSLADQPPARGHQVQSAQADQIEAAGIPPHRPSGRRRRPSTGPRGTRALRADQQVCPRRPDREATLLGWAAARRRRHGAMDSGRPDAIGAPDDRLLIAADRCRLTLRRQSR